MRTNGRMPGRRKRGVAYQRWCKQWIEENYPGSVVHNQPMNHFRLPNGIWACKSNDILGCVDLIAIIPGRKPLFIQCTLDTSVEKRLQDFLKIPWNLFHTNVQLWHKNKAGHTIIKALIRVGEEDHRIVLADVARIERRKICQPEKDNQDLPVQ